MCQCVIFWQHLVLWVYIQIRVCVYFIELDQTDWILQGCLTEILVTRDHHQWLPGQVPVLLCCAEGQRLAESAVSCHWSQSEFALKLPPVIHLTLSLNSCLYNSIKTVKDLVGFNLVTLLNRCIFQDCTWLRGINHRIMQNTDTLEKLRVLMI